MMRDAHDIIYIYMIMMKDDDDDDDEDDDDNNDDDERPNDVRTVFSFLFFRFPFFFLFAAAVKQMSYGRVIG